MQTKSNAEHSSKTDLSTIALEERIDLLCKLGDYIAIGDVELDDCITASFNNNKWFTVENTRKALEAIRSCFLDREKISSWTKHYKVPPVPEKMKTVGLIMAGNIPLVGFHDVLCVFISGHHAVLKCSDKDKHLLPFLVAKLCEWDPRAAAYFTFSEMLKDKDAYIATGSNNTARYFESYFSKYPNIIRKNRNAVAVLDGNETADEMKALGNDIFSFFGLGCRNVSKVYIPRNFDLVALLEVLHNEFKEIVTHDKYKNNFDYNYTLYLLNKVKFFATGGLIVSEDSSLHSRIAALHYEYYDNVEDLEKHLLSIADQIQCVASWVPFKRLQTIPLGATQQPGLFDYPDGVDVMEFLQKLN